MNIGLKNSHNCDCFCYFR